MLLSLVKKQLLESFKGYFIDRKTGKANKKNKVIILFVLFAALMAFLGFAFFEMAKEIAGPFLGTNYSWLYFSICGLMAIMLGAFGSVFNTFSMLYQAKDNELLLSMPIPPRFILLSRITVVYIMSLLYSSVVWIPTVINYFVSIGFNIASLLNCILLLFFIALFVSVITCILGFVVALISSKLKNNSFITVIITLLFLGAYYYFCFNLAPILDELVLNGDKVASFFDKWLNLLYHLAMAANGNMISMLVFTGITIALFLILVFVLSKSFNSIVTKDTSTKKVTFKNDNSKKKSIIGALLTKEFKRFSSSSLYMLNCGLGLVFAPVLAVLLVTKSKDITQVLNTIPTGYMDISPLILLACINAIGFCLSIGVISTPSMSLEGKNIWILKSSPIKPYDVFKAKELIHFILDVIAATLAVLILGIGLKLDALSIISMLVYFITYSLLTADIGVFIGSHNPNFSWTSEVYPIKQNIKVVISMLIGLVIIILTVVGSYLLADYLDVRYIVLLFSFINIIVSFIIDNWYKNKGTRLFEEY